MDHGTIRCPICYANIKTTEMITNCPACKEFIGDKIKDTGPGISTATAQGPGLKPLGDLQQDVY